MREELEKTQKNETENKGVTKKEIRKKPKKRLLTQWETTKMMKRKIEHRYVASYPIYTKNQ